MRALLAVDAPLRNHLHTALIRRGWRVTAAATSAEALSHFGASPFPLVIVADRLPDAEGADLCRTIRRNSSGRACYLIVVQPTSVAESVRPMVDAGADDFITTPISPAYLTMRLAMAEYRLGAYLGADGEAVGDYPYRLAELEHALHVKEASLEELFESAPEGIAVVDERDRFVRVNSEFSRMFGYGADEVLGRPINELIVPPDLRDEALRVTQGIVEGERVMIETIRQHRDGTRIEVSLLATPIRVGNGSIGAYAIYRDITERKAQERALAESEARYRARSEELEMAMQARTRLYGGMSHELRTPISAILLYQEILLSGAVGRLSADQQEALRNSHVAAEHLLELVNDILDLSKIESGKLVVEPVLVTIRELLDDLLVTLRPLAGRHGSEIRLHIADGLDELFTDPQRLRQILLNLLSNAAKFGRGKPVDLRCLARPGEAIIEVEDHGVGIAPGDLEHIFEDFVQVGNAHHSGGTGLGLAISTRLAELLGGRLEVESELGVGSLFRLVLRQPTPGSHRPERTL